MGGRYLLDCTLRDGGYVNDWQFGHDNMVNIFERVVSSGTDYIEIGFLDERRPFDMNRSIFPDTDSAERIYGRLDRKGTVVLAMIDYGTCALSNIRSCKDSFIDGIRVIFKKENLLPAMEFCKKIKSLGYRVFSQLVSITSYSDEELMEAVKLANDVAPFAVSVVDTYGLLDPAELTHIMGILDGNLNKDIILGFHAHNNFQLGYINTTTALDHASDRDILVDGTLYGMGKSAGNAPLELVAMYMNERHGKHYIVTEIQEAIATSVMDFQKRSPWGYQLFYYIAAANRVHPNYVSYLMNKRTLSITAVNEILQRIPDEKKLEKDMKLIEQLYLDHQRNECDDTADIEELTRELGGKKILVLGPGSTVMKCTADIMDYIREEYPVIISINYIPEICRPDYMFVTNTTRFVQSASKLHETSSAGVRLIASSNLTKTEREFDFVVNYSGYIDESAEFPDNSMCMLLRLLIKCGCREAALAGLDGYTADSVNYFDTDKEYGFLKDKADSLNRYARDFFAKIAGDIKIRFITPSEYENEDKGS